MGSDDSLEALREAARLSPDNLPLRRHLGGLLLAAGRSAEAEVEYRAALVLAPGDRESAIGLAEAFVRQGKNGAALVALDSAFSGHDLPPAARITAAKAQLADGDAQAAARHYAAAVGADPGLTDPELAGRIGVAADAMVQPAALPVDGPEPTAPAVPTEQSRTTFADVAGMDGVKEALRMKLLLPFQQADLFAAYGKRAGGGLLLYGPPGVGKTHLARATAGELGADFIDVGLADILDMWVGSSERNLAAIFRSARQNAPCVLFFDEVDALASRRSDMRHAHNRHVINQFLAELDGVDDRANDGVLVLAATNAPWYVDTAFRRPGRFDQLVFVPPPDVAARAAILELLCRDKPLAQIDYVRLARETDGFAGADLKGVVDRAVESKLHESIHAGQPLPIAEPDLIDAARTMRPTAVRDWLATARNYVLHANESGVWDDLRPWFDDLR